MHIHFKQHLHEVEKAMAEAGKAAYEQAKPGLRKLAEDELKKLSEDDRAGQIEAALGGFDPGQIAHDAIDGAIAAMRRALGLPPA